MSPSANFNGAVCFCASQSLEISENSFSMHLSRFREGTYSFTTSPAFFGVVNCGADFCHPASMKIPCREVEYRLFADGCRPESRRSVHWEKLAVREQEYHAVLMFRRKFFQFAKESGHIVFSRRRDLRKRPSRHERAHRKRPPPLVVKRTNACRPPARDTPWNSMRTYGVFSIPVPGPAVWIVLRSAFPYVSVCANRRKESRTVGIMLFVFAEDPKRMSPAGTMGGKCQRERYLDKITKYVHFSAVS